MRYEKNGSTCMYCRFFILLMSEIYFVSLAIFKALVVV